MKYLKLFFFIIISTLFLGHVYAHEFNGISIIYKPVGSKQDAWCHTAVLNSLVRGLEKKNIKYNVNPSSINNLFSTLIVIANVDALQHAIELKKNNKISYLIAGPNFSTNEFYLFLNDEVDIVVHPSQWIIDEHVKIFPKLNGKIKVWFSGVNTTYWNPNIKKEKKHVLIYQKTNNDELCSKIFRLLKNYGWIPCILEYGKYNHENFKNILNNCAFSIFLSLSETQGLALAEAWSMNVPTFAWDPQIPFKFQNVLYTMHSAAPYLTPYTGNYWKEIIDLEILLQNFKNTEYSPRNWVLQNMSDEKSVECLLNLII